MQAQFDRSSNQEEQGTARADRGAGGPGTRAGLADQGAEEEAGRNESALRVGEAKHLQGLAKEHRKPKEHARTGAPKQDFGAEDHDEQDVRLQPELPDQQVHEGNRRNQDCQRSSDQSEKSFPSKRRTET